MNKTVFDLTKWIPPGGEDNFSFRRRDSGEVELSVRYEMGELFHVVARSVAIEHDGPS